MRAIFSLLIFFSFIASANAQGKVNLVIFAEDGDPFYAIINGIKQNSNPETNVKITDLNANSVNVKIIFVDAAIPPVSKNMYLEFNNEYTVKLKRDKKGSMVLRMFGQVPIEQSTSSAPAIVYHATETPVTPVTNNTTVTGNNTAGTTTVVERTETTTTTTTGGTTGTTVSTGTTGTTGTTNTENVSLNMSVNGVGVNMNVNVDGTGTGTGTSTAVTGVDNTTGTASTQITTTTTTTTTTSGNADLFNTNSNVSTGTTSTGTTTNTGTANTASGGCYSPVSDSEFSEFKTSISSKSFSESKMQIAQQITKNNCLSAAQIREIMKTFDFETDRLEYAKFAYQYAYDKNNYYKVNDAFDFESSIDELNEFINSK